MTPWSARRRLAALCAALLGSAGCLNADDYLFNGKKLAAYQLPGNTIPAALIESITFPSGGNTLYGFWVRPDAAASPLTETVLYFHGNEHNIDEFWADVMRLHQTGAAVVIFDYRGYGRSAGSSGREADLDADAEAALAFVQDRGVALRDLCLYGYSLGNVGALHLARAGLPLRCLVVQSGFASAASLVQGTAFLPLPDGWVTQDRFDNAAAIGGVAAPVLVLHGDSDETARFTDNGRVLYERAPQPKRLVLVPGAGHRDLPEVLGVDRYVALIKAWVTTQSF